MKEGQQFAVLTDIITKAWSDKTIKQYKMQKGLKKENLRNNMSNTELILNMLAEASTKDISAATNPESFEKSTHYETIFNPNNSNPYIFIGFRADSIVFTKRS